MEGLLRSCLSYSKHIWVTQGSLSFIPQITSNINQMMKVSSSITTLRSAPVSTLRRAPSQKLVVWICIAAAPCYPSAEHFEEFIWGLKNEQHNEMIESEMGEPSMTVKSDKYLERCSWTAWRTVLNLSIRTRCRIQLVLQKTARAACTEFLEQFLAEVCACRPALLIWAAIKRNEQRKWERERRSRVQFKTQKRVSVIVARAECFIETNNLSCLGSDGSCSDLVSHGCSCMNCSSKLCFMNY